ncbi:MAG: B12-binding domain-containing radical SAM protein [Bacteroidetes bacterium]|nr:B12-binding domain-containing radical SAM protein [Bacteroidota bacterium]
MTKDTIILFYPSPWPEETRGRIPYALLYLERMIRDLGLQIILIDEQVNKDYHYRIEPVKDRILLAGVSSMTGYQIKGAISFSKYIKNQNNALVVWGGWQATLLPEQVLDEDYIDMAIMGQGEIPFRNLVQALVNNLDITEIRGLAYKNNGKIIINPNEKFTNFNDFPKINYGLIDINDYVFKSAYAGRCLGYFTSHGCPYNCGFCCVAEVYGRKWYCKNVDEIISDLAYFKKAANIDCVTFDDDNFFVNKKFTVEFCEQLISSVLNLFWDTSAHAGLFLKLFSDSDIDLFYRSGCRQIYIGAESGDEEVMEMIDKKATVEDNYTFVRILNKHNITPLFSTMISFPSESDRDIDMTLDMIRQAKLIDKSLRTRIFFYTPYPGTELYKKAIEHGFRPPEKMEGWATHTLRKFHAPWWKKDYRWKLEVFANFYLPLVNPGFYKMVPRNMQPVVFIINKLFYPIAYLRFKYNLLRFPIEAIVFIILLRLFNKLFRKNFALGFESYLD